MTNLSRKALNIEDLRRMARRRLTRGLFEFIDRGSEDDVALRHNRAAIERIKLRSRVLNDVSGRDPAITLFGKPHAMPIAIGPTGPAGYVWYRGEIALARAAAKAGVPFALASNVQHADGTDPCRRRRHPVVSALCLARHGGFAGGRRARAPCRLRCADPHGRFDRAVQSRIRCPQRNDLPGQDRL